MSHASAGASRDPRRTVLIVIGVVVVLILGLLVGIVIGKGSSKDVAATATPTGPGGASVTSPPGHKSPKPPRESPSVSPSPAPARDVTFHAYNVTLPDSEGGTDSGLRMMIDSSDPKVTVRVHGGIPSPNNTVFICPIKDLKTAFLPSTCVTPSNNQKVTMPHGTKYGGVEVILIGTGPGGASETTANEIEVAYGASSGSIQVKTPPIAKPAGGSACKDNACNPFFELTPQMTGRLIATATHEGKGTAQLSILVGDVAAHGYSATGTPYDTVDFMDGGFQLKVSGKIRAGDEAALALQNTSTKWLGAATIAITWP